MKRLSIILAVATIFVSCHKGGVKLGSDTDSLAYVIGMNVGRSLMQMDSTLNVEVVCSAIKDVFAESEKLQQMGLDIPKAAELAMALRREGVELPKSIYTHEQLVAAILKRGEGCLC